MVSIDSIMRHFHIPCFGSRSRGPSSSKYSGVPRSSAFQEDRYSAPSPHGSSSSRRHRRHQSSSSSEKESVTFAASRIDEEKLVHFCNRNYGNDYKLNLRSDRYTVWSSPAMTDAEIRSCRTYRRH
ncbi:hypothetical protein F4803DRAFT_529733 [Xylaria telfairii]|nr:hypothetical protein F4803DRAFT_529733 [Xylaria telfairii]